MTRIRRKTGNKTKREGYRKNRTEESYRETSRSEEMSLEKSCDILKEWSLRKVDLLSSTIMMLTAFTVMIVPTIFLNFLIIVTIYRKPSLQKPSFIFLCNLAMSDLGVGMIAIPLTTTWKIAEFFHHEKNLVCKLGRGVFLATSVFAIQSFLTLTAATVDRCLALSLHMSYITKVTPKRAMTTCVGLWLLTVGVTLLGLIELSIYRVAIITGSIFCLATTIYCYLKIYLIVRRHHNQIQSQMSASQGPTLSNIKPFKKTVTNLICVLGTNILFYMPFVATTIVRGVVVEDSFFVFFFWNISVTFVFLNSIVNPLLYCWRLGEIRASLKETLQNLFLCC